MTKHIKHSFIATSVVAALVLSGCSSNPSLEYAKQQQKMQEEKTAKVEEAFKAIPEWFLNPPVNDGSGIYAVGTATADNLQFSLNMAKLQAEFSLAKTFNQEVSGRERSFQKANASGNVESDAESVVTKFVDSSDIVGVNVVDNKAVLSDGKYTVYTLLHLPYEAQAKIIARKAGNTTAVTAKQAYAEIEKELLRRAEERKVAVEKLDDLSAGNGGVSSTVQTSL